MSLIRTLIIDDSAFVRKVVRDMLLRSPFIDVVGMARDGEEALEMTRELKPDVITCDLVMPRCDGVEFVRKQMARRKVPILLLTSSAVDADRVLDALEAGAIDFVQKPTALANHGILSIREELTEKVKTAAQARLFEIEPVPRLDSTPLKSVAPHSQKADIVLIGISTGGPQALRQLLPRFPADFPVPIAIVLHMPVGYTNTFAAKLNELSPLTVVEAADGVAVKPGMVFLAPGGKHLTFRRNSGGQVHTSLDMLAADKPHRPSVDVMFQSAAKTFGNRILAVVMTGMGDDGKAGAAFIKETGGRVLTEAQESCVIYGMPRSVVEAGLSDGEVSLPHLAAAIINQI